MGMPPEPGVVAGKVLGGVTGRALGAVVGREPGAVVERGPGGVTGRGPEAVIVAVERKDHAAVQVRILPEGWSSPGVEVGYGETGTPVLLDCKVVELPCLEQGQKVHRQL